MSIRYGNLLCGEKVALNVPRILSRSALRRTTQDALAERAYANPAHEGRERSVVKLRCLLDAYQSRSGYVRRVRFLVRVTKGKKNTTRIWVVFSLVTRTGIEPMLQP